ncbi:MAG: dynamin family protein [Methylobacter sp.]|nr:dynamin family protein [Methylobacter sp.]
MDKKYFQLNLPLFTERLKIMTSNTLDLLSEETTRILCLQADTLTKALKINNFLNSGTSQKEKTIGIKEIEEWVGHLENERQKLDKLEMVLAVIGTMKAGKSTTINAIVGMEILPNRETAMTTLPTLIRNKHGQIQPVLTINKIQPLLALSKNVAAKLKQLDSDEKDKIDLQGIEDGKTLIAQLVQQGGYTFETEYEGQEAIFEFLRHLNDIMRLAKDEIINILPPYSEYENLDDLPVIEVEFCHLKDNQGMAQGSLAILDTPGPNEFGQSEALRRVFKTQLEKASAVLLVTDFTQMRTEADQNVREQLAAIDSYLSKDRLYVIVNKYDMWNTNCMKIDEVKNYVAGNLMEGKVEATQVFPVSSYLAYLANRAKGYLVQNDKLPSCEQEPWVVDFAIKAFGEGWDEEDINDIAKVKKRIEKLWGKSFFDEPVEKVIKEAHTNAAKISLKSAISKIAEYNREFSNTLNLRSNAMTKNISEIQQMMHNFQSDIDRCEEVKKDVLSTTTKFLSVLEQDMSGVMATQQTNIRKIIDKFFDEGKMMETALQEQMVIKALETLKADNLRNFLRDFAMGVGFSQLIENQNTKYRHKQEEKIRQTFDPSSPPNCF